MSFKGVCKKPSAKINVHLFLDSNTLIFRLILVATNSHDSKNVDFLQILGTF